MTTQATAIPEVARAWVDRMRGDGERRREFTARPVTSKVPEGAAIVRIQWTTTRYMRGGYTQACPVVTWAAWYGAEWVGASQRLCDLRNALDFHIRDARQS